MDTGLYSGISAMNAGEKRVDVIAANLGNMGVAGYKRQTSFAQVLDAKRGTERREHQVSVGTAIDWSQGEIDRTGNPLDVALDGDGFFVVDAPNGPAYTRNGRFHLDDRGVLTTQDGLAVAWEGLPGRLAAVGEEITIDATGSVRQGQERIGRLLTIDFARKSALVQDGVGYYRAPRGAVTQPAAATIHQGALERANVEPIDELVGMISAQRSFENASTILRSIEQSYRRLNQPR